jgi:hypothetical protein
MNTKEIDKKIVELQNKFNAEKHAGKLPKWFKEAFKKAFLTVPSMTHKLAPITVKNLLEKKTTDYTRLDVRMATNTIILAKPSDVWGEDVNIVLKSFQEAQDMIVQCNMELAKNEGELREKRLNMINLAGLNNGGGVKIIHN